MSTNDVSKWKVVPCEATPEMAWAANEAFPVAGETTCSEIGRTIYTAMLAAAPTEGAPALIDADELAALRRDAARYRELSTPEITDFLAAVEREALHQRDRWGVDHDAGKADSDWFWLIGFLAGKALHKPEKMLHHIITTAAACLNWHAARVGAHTAMRPGIAGEGAVMAPKPNHDAALAANGEKGT